MLSELTRKAIRRNLQRSRALDLARSAALEPFMLRDEGKAILLVRLAESEVELGPGLVQLYGSGQEQGAVGVLAFQTAMANIGDFDRTLTAPREGEPRFDVDALARWIAVAPCFPVPIAKVDTAFADRITLGRATNKDIVLRSKNVSKSHAWFERDSHGQLCIADAGSRNGTTVAGVALESRVLRPVPDGVDIRVGRLELTVCSGELFWHLAQVL